MALSSTPFAQVRNLSAILHSWLSLLWGCQVFDTFSSLSPVHLLLYSIAVLVFHLDGYKSFVKGINEERVLRQTCVQVTAPNTNSLSYVTTLHLFLLVNRDNNARLT